MDESREFKIEYKGRTFTHIGYINNINNSTQSQVYGTSIQECVEKMQNTYIQEPGDTIINVSVINDAVECCNLLGGLINGNNYLTLPVNVFLAAKSDIDIDGWKKMSQIKPYYAIDD